MKQELSPRKLDSIVQEEKLRGPGWGVSNLRRWEVSMAASQKPKVDLPCDSSASLPGIFPKDSQVSKVQSCLHINV